MHTHMRTHTGTHMRTQTHKHTHSLAHPPVLLTSGAAELGTSALLATNTGHYCWPVVLASIASQWFASIDGQ
jgi:hypothetical protein